MAPGFCGVCVVPCARTRWGDAAGGDAEILEQGERGRLPRGVAERRNARAVWFGEIRNKHAQRAVLPPPHHSNVGSPAVRTPRGVTQLLFLGWGGQGSSAPHRKR